MIPVQYIDEHNSPNNIAFIKYAKNCNTSLLLETRNEIKTVPIPKCHFSIFSDMNIEIFPPVTVHHTAACLLSQKYQHLDQHLHFSIFVKTLLFFFQPKLSSSWWSSLTSNFRDDTEIRSVMGLSTPNNFFGL